MLSDFSEANLKKIADCSEHFLLQCPKTKVLHRMSIASYSANPGSSTRLYYPVKKVLLEGAQFIFIHRNCYTNRYNGSGFVIGSIKELGDILKSKDFYMDEGIV